MFSAIGVAGAAAVCTELLAAAGLVPAMFSATTWNEYEVPTVRPVNTQISDVVSHVPLGLPVTTYFVTADPPLVSGAAHVTCAVSSSVRVAATI